MSDSAAATINDAENPLIVESSVPNGAPPFDRISHEHFLPAIEDAISIAKNNIQDIKANQSKADFENTIIALEVAAEKLGTITTIFYNQLAAAGTDELQELADKIGPLSANFSSEVLMDEILFEKVKTVHDNSSEIDLTAEQKTLLEETYKGFVRGGALLNDEDKEKLKEINEKLSRLSPSFANNVKKSLELFELWIDDEKDLSGLPQSAVEAAKDAAIQKGDGNKWLFTLDMPSFMPFMQYADDRTLREQIWRAYTNSAYQDKYDNCDTILEIVRLRHERANILGYKTHADFVLERRMAETPAQVFEFLEKLQKTYKPKAEEELRTLKKFANDKDNIEDLKPWDVSYYSEKLKQELFKFSSEDLRPYFPLEKVLDGCFKHFSKLFDITFKQSADYPVWHKDVSVYEVYENKSDKFLGSLYADFFPRTGKKPGAWKTSYRDQGLYKGEIRRPVISIVCNFTKPTNTTPSLLTHGEVSTLFHEMGHALHAMLSDVTYSSLAGTNVLWDFVELPSQLQENWTYQKDTLDMLSSHYKSGDKVPQELINKLNDAKNFMVAWSGLRQINFAKLDMAWHSQDPSEIHDVVSFEDAETAETSLFPRLGGPFSTSFSHIFAGGYAAGYYSYKWAEVLDADSFELFLEKGLYDETTAKKYKTEILSKGGSEHPTILYKNFRGRDADPDALLRREGLRD
jgi:peptidyl-dipeptidase Dcp